MVVTKDGDFCAIHQTNPIIFDSTRSEREYFELENREHMRQLMEREYGSNTTHNPIKSRLIYDQNKSQPVPKKKSTTYDQYVIESIEYLRRESERDSDVKLLILINANMSEIEELVGPVFRDITLSDDSEDALTSDPFWTIENNVKVPTGLNSYYLFSYYDSANSVRCFTTFTIKYMLDNSITSHPVTGEEIPEADLNRARKLIELYSSKIGSLNPQAITSPEFTLKTRIEQLFKSFEKFSIYLEASWIMDLDDMTKLRRIATDTTRLVSNNVRSINPNLPSLKLFSTKFPNNPLAAKELILEEWLVLMSKIDRPENQFPIWILICGLKGVIPEIQEKYPDLQIAN